MPSLGPSQNEPYLSVADVVDRARREFGFVHLDSARGLRFVANRLLSMQPRPAHNAAEAILAPLAGSIELIVGDDQRSDTDFLKCYVIPNEPIEIQYVYEGHHTRSAALLQRLGTILDYELVDD